MPSSHRLTPHARTSDHDTDGLRPAVCYQAFGLTLHSCLPLPVLPTTNARPDVHVDFGPVPVALPEARTTGVRYQAAPGTLLLKVDGVARYLVRDGREVLIDPAPGASKDDVRIFFLSTPLAALLHQRGVLTLHASVVRAGGGAVAFLGRSGAGKSTLAAALQQRGLTLLSDDVCAVTFDESGMPLAWPGYPQTKLGLDALGWLGMEERDLLPVREHVAKRRVPLSHPFPTAPVPLLRLYLLHPWNHDAFELTALPGPARLRALKEHTYRYHLLEGLDLRTPHFEQVARLGTRLPLTQVARPQYPPRLDALVERILADLGL